MRVCAGALVLLACAWAAPAEAAAVAVRVNHPHAVGVPVEFAANGAGTGELTFTWDFGDGHKSEPSTSGTATHTYETPGHYPVIVVVQDDNGARSDSFLQTVHRVLPERPPAVSSTIVHHRDAGRVCNVNADNDTVSCLSTESLALSFEASVGRHPRSLAVAHDGSLWVVNQDDATLSILDSNGEPVDTIELPRASRPFGIAVSPSGEEAYVTLQASGQLAKVDLREREVLEIVDVGPWPTGVAVDGSGERIFVTRFISPSDRGELVELDAGSLDRQKRIHLALDPGPDTEASARGVPNYLRAVVPSPDGSSLWVPSKQDNIERGEARDGQPLTFETSVRTVVSLVDPEVNEERLEDRVDLNNRALGLSLAFSPLGDYAFLAFTGNNGVEVLDAYNRRVVAGTFELGNAPDGLVLDDAGRLYLNAFLSRTVVVLDAAPILSSTEFSLDKVADVVVSAKEKLSDEVLVGKQIFYDASDPRMSQDGYISCASCHLDGFEDGRVWDFTDRGEGLRNTTTLLGKRGTGQGRLHWSANFDEVQDFEHDIRDAFGGSGFLSEERFAEGTRNTPLGDPKAGLSEELDALSAYVTSLDRVHPSPHRDADGSLTEAGWRGLAIFERAGCPECHGGPDFTDSASGAFHDVGTIEKASGGRLGERLEGLDTPTLRGIWETAPYLHDGSAETLLEVVGERNPDDLHGSTSDLETAEIEDLVSYLLQIDNTRIEDEVEPPEPRKASKPATGGGGGCSMTNGRRSSGAAFAWATLLVFMVLGARGRRTDL